MTTTPTGIPIEHCDACDREHPVTRSHCKTCGTASAFLKDGICLAFRNCPGCGHSALKHHGEDGRARPDAGCMALGSMSDAWCQCPHTATEAGSREGAPIAEQGTLDLGNAA